MEEFQLISGSSGSGEYGPYLADLDERFQVIVEYYLFATPSQTLDIESVHRQLARHGMDQSSKRNEEYFANLKREVVANPDEFLNILDATKLGPNDRYCLKYNLEDAKSTPVDTDEFVKEYTYAFTDPPYGIRCKANDEKQSLCSESIMRLFGELSEYTIRRWSTDWSNFFDEGNEYWGAFLWTLLSDNGRGWWIGASATD